MKGEGQYCAALVKTADDSAGSYVSARQKRERPVRKPVVQIPEQIRSMFTVPVDLRQKGDTVVAVPSRISQDVAVLESVLHVLSAGCAAGVLKGQTLVPDADMALSIIYDPGTYHIADVDQHTALSFLHKDAIMLPDCGKGYVMIRHEGVPLGFVKNLGNRCNNLHPQGRRIRMDI